MDNKTPGQDNGFPTIFKSLESEEITISKDTFERNGTIIKFHIDDAVVTIRVELNDIHTNADLLITNMTTLPHKEKGKGIGSKAVQKLIEWAKENGMDHIRATQVQPQSVSFWVKNGFVHAQDDNPTNDFVLL